MCHTWYENDLQLYTALQHNVNFRRQQMFPMEKEKEEEYYLGFMNRPTELLSHKVNYEKKENNYVFC